MLNLFPSFSRTQENLLESYLGMETLPNRWRGGQSKSSTRDITRSHAIKLHIKSISASLTRLRIHPLLLHNTHTHTHTHTYAHASQSINELYARPTPPSPPEPTLTSYRASRGLTRGIWTGRRCRGGGHRGICII